MASEKNYYKTLGLSDFADLDTVKAAYRKLARQYHPDLNPGDKSAEERFKDINQAYEAVGEADKKAFYDRKLKVSQAAAGPPKNKPTEKPNAKQAKPDGAKAQASGEKSPPKQQPKAAPKPPADDTSTTPITELFETFFKPGFNKVAQTKSGQGPRAGETFSGSSAERKPQRGADIPVDTQISPAEAEAGVVKTVTVQQAEPCRRCSATGKVNGTVCPECNGTKSRERTKKIDVRIPAGVKHGSKVRVAQEGGRGFYGGEPGDLFLHVQISIDPSLRIEGSDVYCDLDLSMPEAALGAELTVPTLHGTLKMMIPPLTSSGKVLRLSGQGVQNGSLKGDQLVTLRIVAPKTLSEEERQLYQQLLALQKK